jgi:hypothetical protein
MGHATRQLVSTIEVIWILFSDTLLGIVLFNMSTQFQVIWIPSHQSPRKITPRELMLNVKRE